MKEKLKQAEQKQENEKKKKLKKKKVKPCFWNSTLLKQGALHFVTKLMVPKHEASLDYSLPTVI